MSIQERPFLVRDSDGFRPVYVFRTHVDVDRAEGLFEGGYAFPIPGLDDPQRPPIGCELSQRRTKRIVSRAETGSRRAFEPEVKALPAGPGNGNAFFKEQDFVPFAFQGQAESSRFGRHRALNDRADRNRRASVKGSPARRTEDRQSCTDGLTHNALHEIRLQGRMRRTMAPPVSDNSQPVNVAGQIVRHVQEVSVSFVRCTHCQGSPGGEWRRFVRIVKECAVFSEEWIVQQERGHLNRGDRRGIDRIAGFDSGCE